MRRIVFAAAAMALASCILHGQGQARAEPYEAWNYPSHSSGFFGGLLSGRVWVFENPELKGYADIPHAMLLGADGKLIQCVGHRAKRLHWVESRPYGWEVASDSYASIRHVFKHKSPLFVRFFYDPGSGRLAREHRAEKKAGKIVHSRPEVGWVQDSWPRLFADACPGIALPAGMEINEKQTSSSLRELRKQDPDAVIRRFPGSALTGPGRTGIAASGVPTTTRKEVWAFLNGQEGNVMLGPKGHGRVFVRGPDGADRHEIWGLKDEGGLAWTAALVELSDGDGEWLHWEFDGKVVARYRMGDPLPYLPTGRRHGAWRLTDGLIARGEPLPAPWMGARYEGYRFLFHDRTLTIAAPDGDYLEGRWRWTKGRLVVTVQGEDPVAIAWRDLARELGVEPALVTRAMLDAW